MAEGVPHNRVREDSWCVPTYPSNSSLGFPSYPTNDPIVVAIPALSQKK